MLLPLHCLLTDSARSFMLQSIYVMLCCSFSCTLYSHTDTQCLTNQCTLIRFHYPSTPMYMYTSSPARRKWFKYYCTQEVLNAQYRYIEYSWRVLYSTVQYGEKYTCLLSAYLSSYSRPVLTISQTLYSTVYSNTKYNTYILCFGCTFTWV